MAILAQYYKFSRIRELRSRLRMVYPHPKVDRTRIVVKNNVLVRACMFFNCLGSPLPIDWNIPVLILHLKFVSSHFVLPISRADSGELCQKSISKFLWNSILFLKAVVAYRKMYWYFYPPSRFSK
jgi:hypothetical protein